MRFAVPTGVQDFGGQKIPETKNNKTLNNHVISQDVACIGCSHAKLPKFNSISSFIILTGREKGWHC